ncbi:MAG: branched-chain amino acid ABC transporter permease [Armatimonadetes bacterium]|nr:branched-chain amino acid ABC transporter permease [Armatimonadota bacterium]
MSQQLINAISLGAVYALIALGYTMVYGVLRLINFAHGEVFMVGSFIGLAALSVFHLPFALAVLVAMVGAALLGAVIERGAYRPLRSAPRLAALITAIGVSLLLQNLGMLILGAAPRAYPPAIDPAPIAWLEERAGVVVTRQQVVILAATAAILAGLSLIVSRTKIGKAMRAVSEDRQAAQLMGINVDRVIAFTFCLGSAIAGAGGVFYGVYYGTADPLMGLMPGIKAFVAAVLGGIGSVPGAMLGALLMGLVETGVSSVTLRVSPSLVLTGSTLRDAVAFAVLIAILLLRPAGLLGRPGREKV